MKKLLLYILILLFSHIAFPILADQLSIKGYPRIIDGDTIEIDETKIRFHGIDAPEIKQKCIDENENFWLCGIKAKKALIEIIGSNQVRCEGTKRDRYNRLIAKCYIKNKDIESLMVINGWAVAYIKYSLDYISEENQARENKVGIWNGKFIVPNEWRKQLKKKDNVSSDKCCKICRKGKACGNSCINRNYTCRKPIGCACNAN